MPGGCTAALAHSPPVCMASWCGQQDIMVQATGGDLLANALQLGLLRRGQGRHDSSSACKPAGPWSACPATHTHRHGWSWVGSSAGNSQPNPTQSLHTAQRPSPSLHAYPCSCRHSHSWYMSVVTAPGWISTSGMPRGASSSASSCPAMLAAALLMLHGGIRMVVGQGWHAWAGRLGAAIAMLVQ